MLDRSEWNRALAAGPCRVVFIKKNGQERTMLCSREDDAIEEAGGAGTGSSSPNVVTVVDLEKGQWRCFRPDSVVSFESLAEEEETGV